MALSEHDGAVRCFRRHYVEKNPEIKLYVLLRLIRQYKDQDLWLDAYRTAVAEGVRPRSELKEMYQRIQEGHDFPY